MSGSDIQLNKVKLGKSPCLTYVRFLPNGLEEKCQLELRPVPPDLDSVVQDLLPIVVQVLALDENGWDGQEAGISGVTFSYSDEGRSCTISAQTSYEVGDTLLNLTVNTPSLPPIVSPYFRGLAETLDKIEAAAIKFINQQPKQLGLPLAS